MTTPHPYAELLRAIADGKELQFENSFGEWIKQDLKDALYEFANNDYMPNRYRVKPATITVNGIDVPEPVREPLPAKTRYFIPDFGMTNLVFDGYWNCTTIDKTALACGVIHLTYEAARAHAEAMIAPSKREAA